MKKLCALAMRLSETSGRLNGREETQCNTHAHEKYGLLNEKQISLLLPALYV